MACSGYLAGVCRLVSMDLANFFITLGGLAGSANFGHLHLWFKGVYPFFSTMKSFNSLSWRSGHHLLDHVKVASRCLPSLFKKLSLS